MIDPGVKEYLEWLLSGVVARDEYHSKHPGPCLLPPAVTNLLAGGPGAPLPIRIVALPPAAPD